MYRIDNSTSAAAPPAYPAAGAAGHFTKGNPGTATPATVVEDWWLDQIQEEIINVITDAGLVPAKATNTQLRDAIAAKVAAAAGGGAHGQCRLGRVDATHIGLTPCNGNVIRIQGVPYPIPAAGVQITNAGLAASTLYYVYAYNNAGTPALELSAVGHVTDATAGNIGVEIKNGDASRTLVGMIYTDGAAQFQPRGIGLLSWFNRLAVPLSATNSTINFSSAAMAEISTTLRVSFLTWGEEGISATCDGTRTNNVSSTGAGDDIQLDLDGTLLGGSLGGGYVSGSPSQAGNFETSYNGNLAEGFHYLTPYGNVTPGSVGTITQGYTRVNVRG
jgi:hypothetical protein